MTIHVKAGKIRLHLWLPTGILKSRFGYKTIKRALENEAQKRDAKSNETAISQEDGATVVCAEDELAEQDQSAQTVSITHEQVVEMYKILKRYVKTCGHFNLVEVVSHDGEKVKIRV